MYEAKSKAYPGHPIFCRIYPAANLDKDDKYVKLLRHLGRKHVSIVGTWDIFADDANNVEMMQEYCSTGTLDKYMADKTLEEDEVSCLSTLFILILMTLSHSSIRSHCTDTSYSEEWIS